MHHVFNITCSTHIKFTFCLYADLVQSFCRVLHLFLSCFTEKQHVETTHGREESVNNSTKILISSWSSVWGDLKTEDWCRKRVGLRTVLSRKGRDKASFAIVLMNAWAQQLGGFSNYVQRGFTKDIFGFVDSLFICLFSRGQCDAVHWCSSGQAPLHLSAKLIWEVFRLLGELLINTPPSLTHPRQWNQPERLPLLSELLWELVVLKSCDWLCGNLLANPSATR